MILQSLCELFDRLEDAPDYGIAPPGYTRQKISFKIVLQENGDLFEFQDMRIASGKFLEAQQLSVPGTTGRSGSSVKPYLLWDASQYAIGFKLDDTNPERTTQCFEAFRNKHLELLDTLGSESPGFHAICCFLKAWDPSTLPSLNLDTSMFSNFGVFQILGQESFIHNEEAIERWFKNNAPQDENENLGQCMLSGEVTAIARLHPGIKKVAGANSSGASIVSFNKNAFRSFGKEQSYNAPVSESCVRKYTSALNALLDGPMSAKHKQRLGDTTLVFWTDKPNLLEDIFAEFTSGSPISLDAQNIENREKLNVFFKALRDGVQSGTISDDPQFDGNFYVLGLAPNAARLSVRFFLRSHIIDFVTCLAQHFIDINIVGRRPPSKNFSGDPEFPPMWTLLNETARESKEISPILAGPLLNAVLTGANYPHSLFSGVIRRLRVERKITYLKAAIIKGYLNRNLKKEITMSLDKSRLDVAYRMGRLFAALEKTQLDALPGLNSTIRDRFYASASATPGVVFPRLLRGYQHHMAKLKGGMRVNRERLVQEILKNCEEFPSHLRLENQGLFAIGYYHQMDDFFTKKPTIKEETENREEK